MKSILIENSVIIFAIMHAVYAVKGSLDRLEYGIDSASSRSRVRSLIVHRLAISAGYWERLTSGATLLKRGGSVAYSLLRAIAIWIIAFSKKLYCGSIFLAGVGKAAVNSRWIR